MAQKPNFYKNKKFHKRYDLPSRGKLWSAITRQKIEIESYSNSLKQLCPTQMAY